MTTAGQRWQHMVEAEHAQSDRVRGADPPPQDFWRPLAENFRADPSRPADLQLQRLLHHVEPSHTVIDVGAGGGRYALPLALRCRQVVAVEPSPAMLAVLQEEAERAGLGNLTTVEARWEEAEVPPRDIVLCVHVLYTVREIDDFLRKLEAHARERVLVVISPDWPAYRMSAPFWGRVHGEERLRLPGLRELLEVLVEMGVYPDVEMLPSQGPRGFASREEALESMRGRLFLSPGSPTEKLLEEALDDLLEEVDGSFRVKGASPMQPGLVSWRPRR